MLANPVVQKRQCWSCFKRRIVCDFGQPSCKKCQNAGIDCPGYDEKKPLKWLEPGRVTSKKRSRRPRPVTEKGNKIAEKTRPTDPERLVELSRPTEEPEEPYEGKTLIYRGTKETAKIETLLLQRRIAEAVRLQEQLGFGKRWRNEDMPRVRLRDSTAEVVQAVQFYNERIFPESLDRYQMAPSPHFVSFPLAALHHLPPAISHTLVCFALGYRLHRQELPNSEVWAKVYHHRGVAIRDLSEWIDRCEADKTAVTRKQKIMLDITLGSILVFMCGELQQCASLNWKQHADAMLRLLALRGGIALTWKESPHARSGLLLFIMITVFANTTCPPAEQFMIAPHLELLGLLDDMYEDIFSYCLCPESLFLSVVCINHLRHQLVTSAVSETAAQLVALELLIRIESFVPKEWAKTRGSFEEEFVSIGETWHAATLLFCIMSLQHASLLHPTPQLRAMRAAYGDRLLSSITRSLKDHRAQAFILWPIVVAGVEAAQRGSSSQSWVDERLAEFSRVNGTATSMMARAALRRFWTAEKVGWDECFTRHYAFAL